MPASVTSAGAITGSVPQPCRSASVIASRQCRWVVANGWIFDAKPELREAADFQVRPADLAGQVGAFLQVAFGLGKRQGPCL